MYPNYQNTDENIFPQSLTKNDDVEKVEDYFPFDRSSISQFCQDIFDGGLCDQQEGLQLTYKDYGSLPLSGMAREYCAFTCGNCKKSDESDDSGECWATHNANMIYLSDLNKPIDHGGSIMLNFGNDYFENMFPEEAEEAEDYPEWGANAWDTPVVEEETDDAWGSNDDWSGGWDAWGRKRRSASTSGMEKSELLTEAIESMIFPAFKDDLPLNSRNRRQSAWHQAGMIGQQPNDHDETEKIKNEMYALKCFKSEMLNDDDDGEEQAEATECEGEGCEEETEDPVVRVRQQRHETDHEGMGKWVSAK